MGEGAGRAAPISGSEASRPPKVPAPLLETSRCARACVGAKLSTKAPDAGVGAGAQTMPRSGAKNFGLAVKGNGTSASSLTSGLLMLDLLVGWLKGNFMVEAWVGA